MFVLFFRHSVDLQVDTMEASFPRLQSEIPTLSEPDAVCCSVKPIEAHAFRVPNRIKKNRRYRGLPSREQNIDFPLRLERACIAENEIGRARVGKECRYRWSQYH